MTETIQNDMKPNVHNSLFLHFSSTFSATEGKETKKGEEKDTLFLNEKSEILNIWKQKSTTLAVQCCDQKYKKLSKAPFFTKKMREKEKKMHWWVKNSKQHEAQGSKFSFPQLSLQPTRRV